MSTPPPALRPYQQTGVEFLSSRPRALLADDMGLGKSAQLIHAARGDTLVVAPAMVLDGGTWDDEVRLWEPDIDVTQVAYTSLNVRQKTGKTASSTRVLPTVRPEFDRHWDTLILDEAHYVKNKRANWTQAIIALANRADRVYLATGTPIPNWPHEVFTLLQILRPEDAEPGGDLGSRWRWVETWFRTSPNRWNPRAIDIGGLRACGPSCANRDYADLCDHYLEFVEANFKGVFLQRFRDDVLTDLPALTEQTVEVRMTKQQATAYRHLKRDYLTALDDGTELVAWSSAARHTILDRCATGVGVAASATAEGEVTAAELVRESGKLKRLEYDLADRTRPTLVVAHYRASVIAAAKVASDLGLRTEFIHGGVSRNDRARIVAEFKAGQVDVLVGSLDTISEGLTLTQADLVIFLEKSYRPSRNLQAMRRIHRIGQTRPCLVLDYVSVTDRGQPTIDGGKRELLATKTEAQMRVLTAAQIAALV